MREPEVQEPGVQDEDAGGTASLTATGRVRAERDVGSSGTNKRFQGWKGFMRNRTIMWSAFFLATMILPAAAAPAWPEAHSGAYLGVQMKVVTPERASVLKLK